MAKATKTKNTADLMQEITDKVVAQLEAGVTPWVRPWAGGAPGFYFPHNATTGKPYKGINIFLLLSAGFEDPRWVGFKQAKAAGGHVRKGEKGTTLVRWIFKETKDPATGEVTESFGFPKMLKVWNVSQCDWEKGIPDPRNVAGEPVVLAPTDGERTLDDSRVLPCALQHQVDLRFGGDRAYFRPSTGHVQMPPVDAFVDMASFDSTLAHELTHWTGGAGRLGREQQGTFGAAEYAFEELVAELGAAFMCAALGVQGKLQHAEYIGAWIAVLKKDKRALYQAAKLAQEAVDFLMPEATATDDASEAA